jgi:uncharacterized protein
MDCPHCKQELKPTERQGIEIDYCPNCRGVWLDRGELDKLLERAATAVVAGGVYSGSGGAPYGGGWRRDDDDDDYDDDDRRRHYGQPGYPQPGYGQSGYGQPGYDPRRRRRSWLGDLFDFD